MIGSVASLFRPIIFGWYSVAECMLARIFLMLESEHVMTFLLRLFDFSMGLLVGVILLMVMWC